MADNGNKLKKGLGDCLKALEIRYEQQDDVFFVYYKGSDLPFGTFLVVPADNRISFFSAFPFEVIAERLRDTLIAMNALNDIIPSGRFYFDVNSTDNAIFYDQYLLYTDGNVVEKDIKFLIKNDIDMTDAYSALLSDVNEGKLSIKNFIKKMRMGDEKQ